MTKIRSEGVYADPIKRNVIEHVAAETDSGKTVYIGTRLKVVDGKIAYAILHYANGRRMQINEVFKILDGRIRLVDNIGLMGEGFETSGFEK